MSRNTRFHDQHLQCRLHSCSNVSSSICLCIVVSASVRKMHSFCSVKTSNCTSKDHRDRCHKQYIGETKRRLKTVLTSTAEQLSNKQTVLNLLQSRNIFFLTTITLLTCYLFLSNSSNLIVTVYAKLERHTSSIEVKLLNL